MAFPISFNKESSILPHSKVLFSSKCGILVSDHKSILWLSENGGCIRHKFSFNILNDDIDATICSPFPPSNFSVIESEDLTSSSTTSRTTSSNNSNLISDINAINEAVVAILITPDLLRLHMHTGEFYDVPLPYPMAKVYSSPYGLLLEKKLLSNSCTTSATNNDKMKTSNDLFEPVNITNTNKKKLEISIDKIGKNDKSNIRIPLLFSLSHPSTAIRPVQFLPGKNPSSFQFPSSSSSSSAAAAAAAAKDHDDYHSPGKRNTSNYEQQLEIDFEDMVVMAVKDKYVCTINKATGRLSLWIVRNLPPPPPADVTIASLDISNTNTSLSKSGNLSNSNSNSSNIMSSSMQFVFEKSETRGSPIVFGGVNSSTLNTSIQYSRGSSSSNNNSNSNSNSSSINGGSSSSIGRRLRGGGALSLNQNSFASLSNTQPLSSSTGNQNASAVLASMLGISPSNSRGSSPSTQPKGRGSTHLSIDMMATNNNGSRISSPATTMVIDDDNADYLNTDDINDTSSTPQIEPEISLILVAFTDQLVSELLDLDENITDLDNTCLQIDKLSISYSQGLGADDLLIYVHHKSSGKFLIFSTSSTVIEKIALNTDQQFIGNNNNPIPLNLVKPTSFINSNGNNNDNNNTGTGNNPLGTRSLYSCHSIAHTLIPIGNPVVGLGGFKIPLTILLDQRNNNDNNDGRNQGCNSLSLMIGTHIYGNCNLEWKDDLDDFDDLDSGNGDDTDKFIGGGSTSISTVSTNGRCFLMSQSNGSQAQILSLPTAFFIDSKYPNQDVAISLISSFPTDKYPTVIESILGLMIQTEIVLGSQFVLPCLLSAIFSVELSQQVFENESENCSKMIKQESINSLLACILQVSILCRKFAVSPFIFDNMHICFEDLRLSQARSKASHLGQILFQIVQIADGIENSTLLGYKYCMHYQLFLNDQNQDDVKYFKYFTVQTNKVLFQFTGKIEEDVPCGYRWICECISHIGDLCSDAPDLNSMIVDHDKSKDFPTFCFPDRKNLENSIQNHSSNSLSSFQPCPTLRFSSDFLKQIAISDSKSYSSSAHKFVDAFVRTSGGDLTTLTHLPSLLRSIVEMAFYQCRINPIRSWPDDVLALIGRNDLCRKSIASSKNLITDTSLQEKGKGSGSRQSSGQQGSSDGLQEVEALAHQLRFAEDDRVHEVCRLLRSSCNIYLRVEKTPETSDLDHRQKLQIRLLTLCRRTLACPVGRGILTMGSLEPLMAEALPIPPLVLAGRVPPANSMIPLDTSNATAELTLWPEFHNGVAAGLRIGPKYRENLKNDLVSGGSGRRVVTRNWIIYNRTATANTGSEAAHAGVLLALGLQGHLSVLSVTDVCDYLTQGHEPTTVAVLIGMAAAKLGTADTLHFKTLCLHLPALLPPRHWDIEISPIVQCSALIGLGLLHCGSGHRLMTEFLLAEMSRRPTSDRCETREAMALSIAWALGMVLLGKGCDDHATSLHGLAGLKGLSDLHIEDRLQQHMDGGKRPPDSHLFPTASLFMDLNSKSSRVFEGEDININVTAPGASIALALIYLKSNNVEAAKRLAMPTTSFALDSIRPDLLFYRAVGRCLILWDSVEGSTEWMDAQIPEVIMKALFSKNQTEKSKLKPNPYTSSRSSGSNNMNSLHPRAALSAYLCIISGYCVGIGLVFAGTADESAKTAILTRLKMIQSFRDMKAPFPLPFPLDKSIRPLIEMCVSCCSVSLSYVMAGTGDLACLRIFRELRWKVDDVNYGSHLSIAMAIGMLFIAGGNSSLRRDSLSVACLLLSICPRFPLRTADNQYHLQPLRHMYVLAVENRSLRTVDVDTGISVPLNVEIEMVDGRRIEMRAPCLLPELATVKAVHVNTDKYYPTCMTITSNSNITLKKTDSKGNGTTSSSRLYTSPYSSESISLPPLYVKKKHVSNNLASLSLNSKISSPENTDSMNKMDDESNDYNKGGEDLLVKNLSNSLSDVLTPFATKSSSSLGTISSLEGSEMIRERVAFDHFLSAISSINLSSPPPPPSPVFSSSQTTLHNEEVEKINIFTENNLKSVISTCTPIIEIAIEAFRRT